MTREEEIQLVYNLLIHPGGYTIDMDGSIWIRRYEIPRWAVEWDIYPNDPCIEVQEFDDPMEAAKFFVNKRHENKSGLEYEREIE